MKKMGILILVVVLLGGLAGGTAFLVQQWKLRSALKDVEIAETYLNQGKAVEAEQVLARRLQNAKPGAAWIDSALALRFRALDAIDDPAASQALADQVLDPARPWVEPGDEAWGRAMEKMLLKALEEGNVDRSRELADKLIQQPEGSYGQTAGKLGQARIKMATGMSGDADFVETRATLETVIKELPQGSPLRLDAEFALGALNMAMLRTPQPYGSDQLYELKKGDTIYGLSRKFKVSGELIMLVNNIRDAGRLTVGQRIKIPDLNLSILVNKADNTVTLFNHGQFFKKYRCRTGEHEYQTPAGDYTIERKVTNPPWKDPKSGKSYPSGDPENQLGVRWMAFKGSLGIHEAIDPSSVGTYSSSGCVGLVREDIEELYDLVKVGTPVKIIGQKNESRVITVPSKNPASASPAPAAAASGTTTTAEPSVVLPELTPVQ